MRFAIVFVAVALGSACASSTPGQGDGDAGAALPDASPVSDARAVEPSARGAFCAGAGRARAGDTRVTVCAGPVELVTEPRVRGDVTWQPGPIYVIEPSGGQ